jgi:hypothetical protein
VLVAGGFPGVTGGGGQFVGGGVFKLQFQSASPVHEKIGSRSVSDSV